MNKPIHQKHKDIRQRSFETRYRLLLFSYILQDIDMEVWTEEILKFQITPPLVEIYTTVYYQNRLNDRVIDFVNEIDFPVKTSKTIESIGKTHKDLITKIQRQNNFQDIRETYFRYFEEEIFPKNEFEQFFTEKIQGCRYCGIKESQIEKLSKFSIVVFTLFNFKD